jgi:hypothetical protein
MTKCNKCHIEYTDDQFYKGQGYRCKQCAKEHRIKYQQENKDKINQNKKRYYEQTILDRRQRRREETAEAREKAKQERRLAAIQRKEERRAIQNERAKEWARNNRGKVNARTRAYGIINPNAKLAQRLRTLMLVSLKRRSAEKTQSTFQLTGCSINELRLHLESMFQPGMNWANHSRNGWHIDHIKPCASFDLSDPKQQQECFHYSNLRPLWAEDNIRKSNKLLVS